MSLILIPAPTWDDRRRDGRIAGVARTGMWGFLFGAAGMFATMYSTQAILPELGNDFGVAPSTAGLTISVLVVSHRRRGPGFRARSPTASAGAGRSCTPARSLIAPSVGVALAPTFGVLLLFRALQGLACPASWPSASPT